MITSVAAPAKKICSARKSSTASPNSAADRPSCLSRTDFEKFVCEYSNRLLAVASRILRSEDDAADAVQDALLSAFEARHRFQGDSSVYTWLYRIVINCCLMKLRSKAARPEVSLEGLQPGHDIDDSLRHPVIPEADCGDSCLERDELRMVIVDCINLLPADHQSILRLRDIEEFDTDQTAALLKLSRSAVKTRLHRARRALKSVLEPLLP